MQIFSRSREYPAIPILNSTLARLSHNSQHVITLVIHLCINYIYFIRVQYNTVIATLIEWN